MSSASDDDRDRSSDASSRSSSSRSRHDDDDDSLDDSDAIVISTRSQIVISPRRRVSAATWDSFERQVRGADRNLSDAAEQVLGGVDALRRAQSTARQSESPIRFATKSSDSRARASDAPRTSNRSRGAAKRETSPSNKSRRSDSSRRAHASRSGSQALDPPPLSVENGAGAERTASTRSSSRRSAAATTRSRSHRHRERHTSHSSDSSGSDSDDRMNSVPRSRRDSVRRPPPAPQTAQNELLGSSSSEDEETKQGENDTDSNAAPAYRAKSSSSTRQAKQRQHREQSATLSVAPSLRKHETRNRTSNSSSSKAKTKTSTSTKTTTKGAVNERSTRQRREAAASSSSDASSVESPRSRPSAKSKKHASFLSEQSVDDAAAVGVLPSPKEEMEELKQTLKNLASHDTNGSSSGIGGASVTGTMSGGDNGLASHRPLEYLRVATGALAPPSPADQLRLGEYVSQQPFGSSDAKAAVATATSSSKRQSTTSTSSRHASFDPATLDSKLREARDASTRSSSASRSQSLSAGANGMLFGDPPPRTSSLSQKLFSQNPTGAAGAGGATAASSGLFMPTSSPFSANGTSGLLGIGGSGITSAAAVAAASGAQGSRAVLSALKALQDKIRRLEEERETLTQQLSDERVKSRKVQQCVVR